MCRKISETKQQWKYKNGILMRGSPEKMFDKFFHISSSLSESARTWPIQLCSKYFASLVKELANIMLTGGFQMPLILNIYKKSNQLDALK